MLALTNLEDYSESVSMKLQTTHLPYEKDDFSTGQTLRSTGRADVDDQPIP